MYCTRYITSDPSIPRRNRQENNNNNESPIIIERDSLYCSSSSRGKRWTSITTKTAKHHQLDYFGRSDLMADGKITNYDKLLTSFLFTEERKERKWIIFLLQQPVNIVFNFVYKRRRTLIIDDDIYLQFRHFNYYIRS